MTSTGDGERVVISPEVPEVQTLLTRLVGPRRPVKVQARQVNGRTQWVVVLDHNAAWLVWGVASGGTFLALEFYRIGHGKSTLSSELRRLFGINPPKPYRKVGGLLVAAGCAVFASHIVFGKP